MLKRVQANIYSRTSSIGRITWMVRWKDPVTGKWKAYTAGNTQTEARILLGRVQEALLRGEDPTPRENTDAMTLSDLADRYFESVRFINGTPQYQKVIRLQIEKVILPHFKKAPVKLLTREHVVGFYVQLKKQGLSHKTIHRYHITLCALLDVYSEIHPDHLNPARTIRSFTKLFPRQAPTRDINFLTPEETDRLLRALTGAKNPLVQPLMTLLAYSGMRRSEALELRWSDIDRAGGFIHIRQSKNGKARTIPLEKKAWDAIRDLPKRFEHIFCYEDGTLPDKDSFLGYLKTAAKRCKIQKRIDIHTLRHSYGSNKIRQGWGIKKVSMILGHSDISITSNVYSHLLDGDLKVRDEVRFDSTDGSNNIGKSKAQQFTPEQVTTMLTTLFTQIMNGSNGGGRHLGWPCYKRATNVPGHEHAHWDPQKAKSRNLERFRLLSFFRSGGPARARTWDLQIRRRPPVSTEVPESTYGFSLPGSLLSSPERLENTHKILFVTVQALLACSPNAPSQPEGGLSMSTES
jgi:integrase